MNRKGLLALALLLTGSGSVQACEPIIPFIQVVGGPALLTQSVTVLIAAVALKSIAFAAWQKPLGFWHALTLMIAGNALTTGIGVVAAAMLGSGALLLFGIGVAWMLALVPARRLIATAPGRWLGHFTGGGLAGVLALALGFSCVLFSFAATGTFADRPSLHWGVKLVAIYLALVVSIVLTAFWEEWTIWQLAPRQDSQDAFLKPVVSANLLVLAAVMVYAAAVMFPQRLSSPTFLVKPAPPPPDCVRQTAVPSRSNTCPFGVQTRAVS